MFATLLPGASEISLGRNKVWRGLVNTQLETNVAAYVKLSLSKDSNSLAKELILALLARRVGLPVPEIFLVNIGAMALPEERLPSGSLAIGLRDANIPSLSQVFRDQEVILPTLLKWPQLYACAAFDAWSGISDRLPDNLLYDGKNMFQIIDFDDALPSYLSESNAAANGIIRCVTIRMSEHEKYAVRKKLMDASLQYNRLVNDKELLEDVYSLVSIIPNGSAVFPQVIDTLTRRLPHLMTIFNQQLNIKQLELFEAEKNRLTNKQ